ncbi:snRNA-activating protein of 50kDa MW C terminal-domain-containing protein [Mucor mucedo]|uniref:snRNA-activating protein of 50kDa MW C terminal-domain-containing protein n=1 Tax=Mucor mucedo TaxID=29922 RepID=UPI00221F559A|nr:snRNA-activating protein of 50kDa MW C terminal-domain-containing protein [Mucor mucedo]KAI7888951.1 snRNA-activating protein of 50kDa MW C terminal-domain-containing protein [Mucor mucedo]
MTTPNQLTLNFKDLFEQQEAIEKDPVFQAKKNEYKDRVLESKYNLATLSEIFQDPDLISRISTDIHSLITEKERISRVRQYQHLTTTKKPQAKDVSTVNTIAEEEWERIKNLEESRTNLNEYISPIASRKRKYLSMPTTSPPPEIEEPLQQSITAPTTINSELALPSVCITDNNTTNTEQQGDDDPLENSFKETAKLFQQSLLKSIGPKYLYTLLPRQCESSTYKYVKDNYTPHTTVTSDDSKSLEDTLITITIYNPQKTDKKFQEIEILGSQKLSDFRDAMYCLSDFLSNGDKLGQIPTGEIINTSEKKLSPSIIYMDHVFYLDTRLQQQDDYYDELIKSWLTRKGVNKGVFKYEKKAMEDAVVKDIPIYIHKPFVFLHQDGCEHMLQFQDVRLLSPSEYQSKSEFPRTTHNLKYDRFKCSMCTIFPATKITEEEVLSGFSPCYFCDKCFVSFHNEHSDVVATDYIGTVRI